MTMGEKILGMRKARGWSQEELAERIGVSRQAVSRWEIDSAKPDADKIVAICDLFGVPADYLLRDIQDETGTQVINHKRGGVMVPRWWLGGILILICGISLLAIWIMSVMYPVAILEEQKLRDFLLFYRIRGIWYLLQLGLAVGLWKLLTPRSVDARETFSLIYDKVSKKMNQIVKRNRD